MKFPLVMKGTGRRRLRSTIRPFDRRVNSKESDLFCRGCRKSTRGGGWLPNGLELSRLASPRLVSR